MKWVEPDTRDIASYGTVFLVDDSGRLLGGMTIDHAHITGWTTVTQFTDPRNFKFAERVTVETGRNDLMGLNNMILDSEGVKREVERNAAKRRWI